MDKKLELKPHRGIAIELQVSHNDVQFVISGEQWAPSEEYGSRHFASYDAAKKAIDDFFETEAKLANKAIKIAIPILDEDGNEGTIVGLNRATGRAKMDGYKDAQFEGDAYPPLPWVKDGLARMKALWEEYQTLREKIDPLKVAIGGRFSRQIAATNYAYRVNQMVAELQKAREKAETEFAMIAPDPRAAIREFDI